MSTDTAAAATSEAPAKKSGRGRGAVAWILVVIASLLLPVAVVAFWGQRTITDAGRWLDTTAPLAAEQSIQQALITKTTNTLVETINTSDVAQSALSALPPQAVEKLKAPIEGAITALITQVVSQIVESPQFVELWEDLSATLQEKTVALLSGDNTGPVSIQGDELVLDTGQIAEAAKQELVDRGLTVLADKPIPAKADQQIVLMQSEQIEQAQKIYKWVIPLARYLGPALAVLLLVAVWVSRRRARVVMGIGIGLVVGAGLLSAGLAIGQKALDQAASQQDANVNVVNAFWTTLTKYLATSVTAYLTVGAIVAVLGWFGGRSRPATAVRRSIGSSLTRAGAGASDSWLSGIGGFMAKHWRAAYIVIASGGLAAILLLGSASVSVILWSTAVCLALAAVVMYLVGVGGGRVEPPAATPAVAEPQPA